MAALAEAPPALNTSQDMTRLSALASEMGFEIVDLAAFFDAVDIMGARQLEALMAAEVGARQISSANAAVFETIGTITTTTVETLAAVERSTGFIRESMGSTQEMATWVNGIEERVQRLEGTLSEVIKSNSQITAIAKQVNILAINATIEAARAGDAGKGFAVVADAINELSRKTARAAEGIGDNIEILSEWTAELRKDATVMSGRASDLIERADQTNGALEEIAQGSRRTHENARGIETRARDVERAGSDFEPVFARIGTISVETTRGIHSGRERLDKLVDGCEAIVQCTASLGAESADGPFVSLVCENAETIGALFERALAQGRISETDLFDTRYQRIPGSNPEQFLTGFTNLTDTLLPPILEEALEFDPRVVFSAAVDQNGYLPTHNKKFSLPPSDDAEWNAGHCRNRRVFNDRVGLKAGQNTSAFLLQVYRRDMGNGEFVLMKDLSAPIWVNGRHWGGLRLAYGV